jgi:formate C-acetyltransferase
MEKATHNQNNGSAKAEVDFEILKAIDQIELSKRAATLKNKYLTSTPMLVAERIPYTIEAWKESEGDPLDLRWAKIAKKCLENDPVAIFKGQKIAGNVTKYFRGSYPHPENDANYLNELLEEDISKITIGGDIEKADIENLALMKEAAAFFKNKSLVEMAQKAINAAMGDWDDLECQHGSGATATHGNITGYGPLDTTSLERLVKEGLRSFIAEIDKNIETYKANFDDDVEKLFFWEATKMTLEATITYAKRYARLAREQAAKEKDPAWRAELEVIASMCEWVPENPARTFREGVQSVILIHAAVSQTLTYVACESFGRMDRYLYPLFKKDIDEGRLTAAEAVDIMTDVLCYATRVEVQVGVSHRLYKQMAALYESIGIAGTDEDGNDACNELSYAIVHAAAIARYAGPNIMIGWHKDIASWFMDKAMWAVWQYGGGQPQFQNIDHFIKLALKAGFDIKDARNTRHMVVRSFSRPVVR